jgi:protein-disulfide isomerase
MRYLEIRRKMKSKELIEKRRARERKKRQRAGLLIGSGAVLILVAAVVLISNRDTFNISREEFFIPELEQPQLASGAAVGNSDAPVTIVDYSDFGCGHCADFSRTTGKELFATYVEQGDVYFEFKSVGGLLGSTASVQAAEAAYCAADQEVFWPYHDLIFANQAVLFADRQADLAQPLKMLAEILEMDLDEFEDCFDSGKYRERVQQDEVDARTAGVTGTPSFSVNGRFLQGNQPLASFQEIIEQELALIP